jgi:glycosyltransferase involved in cell wall biosynthesis
VKAKKIYIEPTWKLHMGYHVKELIPYPPEGYEFVTRGGWDERLFDRASSGRGASSLSDWAAYHIPLFLIKSYVDRFTKKPPDARLTYSCHHLVFRNEPWVVEVGRIWEMIGHNPRHFYRFRGIIERAFASENCKRVLCFTEFSRKTCLSVLNCQGFEHKIDVLPRAVYAKEFVKSCNHDKVRLLFVGSANLAGLFEYRGGKELLEAFSILSGEYENLELVIRSDIPPALKERYEQVLAQPNVTVLEGFLPWEQVEQLYQSSDIFFFPCHYESWQIILEAMSYGLSVIAIGLEGVSEFVKDGESGFLVPEAEGVPSIQEGLPLANASPQVRKALRRTDSRLVQALVEKASMLIEDRALRRRMGTAGRWQVEQGDCSLERRKAKLKEVFDLATS